MGALTPLGLRGQVGWVDHAGRLVAGVALSERVALRGTAVTERAVLLTGIY
jgi:hypothetical protein